MIYNATFILVLFFKIGVPLKKELKPGFSQAFIFSPEALYAILALFSINTEINKAASKLQIDNNLKIMRVAGIVSMFLLFANSILK